MQNKDKIKAGSINKILLILSALVIMMVIIGGWWYLLSGNESPPLLILIVFALCTMVFVYQIYEIISYIKTSLRSE